MPDTIQIIVRGEQSSVVRLGWRRYPAITVQGDTYHNSIRRLEHAKESIGRSPAEACRELGDLLDEMRAVESLYVSALKDMQMQLPWPESD